VMEIGVFMIYKISPGPSRFRVVPTFPKRGKEKKGFIKKGEKTIRNPSLISVLG